MADLVGQLPHTRLYVGRRAAQIQGVGEESSLGVPHGYRTGRLRPVVLAIDEQAFGKLERGGVGKKLVVVGFPPEPLTGNLVFGISDVAEISTASKQKVWPHPDLAFSIEDRRRLSLHAEAPLKV